MKKIIYPLTLIIVFFTGVIGTIVLLEYIPIKKEVIEKTVNEVRITETDTIKTAINKIYDAVVLIETYKGDKLSGTGTGFVYKKDDKNGYIITNHHVIENGTTIKVLFINGDKVDAQILGSDWVSDTAVLVIDENHILKVAEIGESSKLELGDTLFTVGSPLGEEYMGTVTKGILSGKDRTVEVGTGNNVFMLDVIQTDAAINPGNSGGPLVNINGEIIGVNSLKLVKDEIEGMGFAIPIEIVMNNVDRLEKGQEIIRPLIGVQIIDAQSQYDLFFNHIFLDKDFDHGVVIVNLEENFPAYIAGLRKKDVILEINGIKVTGVGHFRFLLYKYEIGETIKVKYYRSGEELEAKVKLDKSVENN